jgi:hypothetical protein
VIPAWLSSTPTLIGSFSVGSGGRSSKLRPHSYAESKKKYNTKNSNKENRTKEKENSTKEEKNLRQGTDYQHDTQ